MYIHVCLCIPRSGRGLNLKKKLTHPSGKKKYEKEFFFFKSINFFPYKGTNPLFIPILMEIGKSLTVYRSPPILCFLSCCL